MPALVEAREIIAEFHMMIRRKAAAGLGTWIERARASLVASFANGVTKDEAAVRQQLLCLGRMHRPKVKSRASSLFGAKCMVAAISICLRPD
jgi:hypothetical protein